MAFWDEWKEGGQLVAIGGFLTIVAGTALSWVITNVPTETNRALIFILLLIMGMIMWVVDYLKENNKLFGALDLGKNKDVLLRGIVFGAIALFIISSFISKAFTINVPVLASVPITESWVFFYIVLIAPYVEERFFRGSLFPTLHLQIKEIYGEQTIARVAPYLAVILTSVVFAFFHYLAYNADGDAMTDAFLFSVFAITGNQFFKTIGFGLGMHFINNALAYMNMQG